MLLDILIYNINNFRSEPFCAEKLSAKLTIPSRNPDKSIYMKGMKTLIHNTHCPTCLCQNCVCSSTQKSISNRDLDISKDSKEKLQSSPAIEAPHISFITQTFAPNPCPITHNWITMDTKKSVRKRRKAPKDNSNLKSVDFNSDVNAIKRKSSTRTCTKCGLIFSSHREVLLHSRIHVSEKTKEFGCHLCGKYFSQRTTLRQHLILHSGEKNFVCTICEKRFALKIYLKSHQKSCGPVSKSINFINRHINKT